MNQEADRIRESYARRAVDPRVLAHGKAVSFQEHMLREREECYRKIIQTRWPQLSELDVLEIGAGTGTNIRFLQALGIPTHRLFANELLEDRLAELRSNFPGIQVLSGDIRSQPGLREGSFDLILQSTVFTSILDEQIKQEIAQHCWQWLKPGGMFLWYDFIYDNPRNPDVKGIGKAGIRRLFPLARSIDFRKVTLAPPIGRRVGSWYPAFNLLPFLRTHLIATIIK